MVILHGAWLDGALRLWAETWSGGASVAAPPSSPVPPGAAAAGPPALPYDAGADTLRQAVSALPDAVPLSDRDTCEPAVAWLPTVAGRPVHSRETWGFAPAAATASAPALQPWRVTILSPDWRVLFAVLGACRESRRLTPGVIAGADLEAWSLLFRLAGALVARQAFLPGLVAAVPGYESRWQPAFDGADRARLFALARRLPAAARGLAAASAPAPAIPAAMAAEAFVAEAVDRLVRWGAVTTLSRAHARRGRYFSAHDAWLASLRGDECAVRWACAGEVASLAGEIAAWRRPVDLASRAPWRLALRLEEPADEAHGTWFLRYMLQAYASPEALVPLADAWRTGGRPDASRRELALLALGQAAALCPFIGRDLSAQESEGCRLTVGEAHAFLTRSLPLLEAAGFGVQAPAWWSATDRRPRLELVARATTAETAGDPGSFSLASLVDVDWQVALGGEPVTVAELEQLAHAGEPLVKFRGRWLEADPRQAAEALRLARHRAEARSAGDLVRLMIGIDADAHGLRVGGVAARGWVDRLLQRLRGTETPEEIPPPTDFRGELRPYQKRGYAWLAFLRAWGFGACLADDMGLGKTVQALALFARERERGERRPVLLVCPTSVIGNWEREAARFTPGLAVMRHHGPDRARGAVFAAEAAEHALVVTGYALLPRDYAALRQVSWAGIVLDEAQNIKNPDTRQSQAARALSADYRLALTGTPVENHVGDLWSIMDFLNPGLLGGRAAFRDRFLRPIQAGIAPEARERLRRATAPFMLRRLKTDRAVIADLPEKVEARVFCPLTREQAGLYAAVLQELDTGLAQAAGLSRRGLVLATITRLKQICNHPAQYARDDADLAGRSGKLDRLTEMLDEVVDSGDRALVFTQFAAMGALLQRHIGQTFGFEPPFLYGGVPRADRDRMVAAFQEADGPPVFVLSLRAGGTGLNLTAANHVFHFDRWWNPAVENQATDRAFRIGQTRRVMVHKLVCAGTLEDRIDAMIAAKTAVAEDVVGSGETWLAGLPDDELKRALALAPDAIMDERDETDDDASGPQKETP